MFLFFILYYHLLLVGEQLQPDAPALAQPRQQGGGGAPGLHQQVGVRLADRHRQVSCSVETNLFFERIRIPNLIRNPEIFRIRIRILFVVKKISNLNPNIRDSEEKIRIRIQI